MLPAALVASLAVAPPAGAQTPSTALTDGVQTPTATAQAPSTPLGAKAAILMEASTGDVLFARNADQRRQIASTTKLMTVLVALERADLDDVYSAIDYRAPAIESQIGLRVGERMSVRDLLRAMLLPSANDAAATVAVGALGSQAAFVTEMNRRAASLGLRGTHFENPVGLDDPRNYSTARDLARVTIRLRRDDFFRRTVDLPSATLRSTWRRRIVVFNRNTLVRRIAEVDGVKTGHTARAGYVLVGSATRNGVTVVSVVLGEPSESARDADSLALLRRGLAAYERRTPLVRGRPLGRVALRYRGNETVDVVAGATVARVVRRGTPVSVTVTGLPDDVDGPLPRGSRLGTAVVRAGGTVIARVPVVAARAVAEAGFGTRLGDVLGRAQTIVALVLLLACSLPLVLLRRRAITRSRALDAEHQRARRREESPVP